MKKRVCDKCKKEIKSGNKYVKCYFQEYKDKKIKLQHCSDICLNCWDKFK